MKINATLPFDEIGEPEEFLEPEAISEISRLLEKLGFDGANVTDHPCPTGRWLDVGGHYAQDPFVLLSFVAAATRTLRIQTGILVLPYRNPFITARMVATLDVFSKGRVTLGMGAGYLKGEFRALGVDFDQRNELMDEYIRAMKAAWCEDEFTFKGTGYEAFGNRILPRPIQRPHPPLLIGGNSRRAIRRAAELGDGWNPVFQSGPITTTTRTASIRDEEDLAAGIQYMREHCEKIGRVDLPGVVMGSVTSPDEEWNPAMIIDRIGNLEKLGVSGAAAYLGGRTRAEYCDNAERMSAEVLSKIV